MRIVLATIVMIFFAGFLYLEFFRETQDAKGIVGGLVCLAAGLLLAVSGNEAIENRREINVRIITEPSFYNTADQSDRNSHELQVVTIPEGTLLLYGRETGTDADGKKANIYYIYREGTSLPEKITVSAWEELHFKSVATIMRGDYINLDKDTDYWNGLLSEGQALMKKG